MWLLSEVEHIKALFQMEAAPLILHDYSWRAELGFNSFVLWLKAKSDF